jgi:protein-disulfide isomerase
LGARLTDAGGEVVRSSAIPFGWLLGGLLALAACGSDREELAELRDRQDEILERLSKLEAAEKQEAEQPRTPRGAEAQDHGDIIYRIDVGSSPTIGNPDAAVTIVEFSDFQCPYCARTAPLLRQILERHGDDVRLVYKHFPLSFHPQARSAARAALAAQDQRAFWEMHDLLFEHSERLGEARFADLARRAGLDVERFSRDYDTRAVDYDRRIDEDYAQGLTVNVRGTPTLFVNGRRVRVRTVDGISAMIDEELERASSS